MLTGKTTGRKTPPVSAPVTAVAAAEAVNWLIPIARAKVVSKAWLPATWTPCAPAGMATLPSLPGPTCAAADWVVVVSPAGVEQLAVQVGVEADVRVEAVLVGHQVDRGEDLGVAFGAAAEPLGEDRRAGVGDGVRRVLGDPLMGVGVAAFEHERDAADEGDHRECGDDDDLAALPTIGARGKAGQAVHGDLKGGVDEPTGGHGCFGHRFAVG